MKVFVLLFAHPCQRLPFLTIKILELGFVVFIRVVERPLIFQMLLVSLNMEVYNSSYGQNKNRGAHTFLGCAHKIGQQLQEELRCAHLPGLCAQDWAAAPGVN